MIRHSHPPVFPLNPFPPSYAPPVLGAPSGTARSYRHKQPVGKPMGCCHMPCARCTPRSGAGGRTSHTAPIYAGAAHSVELYRTKGYAIECHWSLVRVQPSAPRPKADSVQGLKAGKPLPAGCVQICPVSRAWLREGPFDLPALNRALLRTRRRLRDESVNAGYRGECSKVATRSPKPCVVGSIPNCPCQMYATALRHHGRVRPLQGACLCAV